MERIEDDSGAFFTVVLRFTQQNVIQPQQLTWKVSAQQLRTLVRQSGRADLSAGPQDNSRGGVGGGKKKKTK